MNQKEINPQSITPEAARAEIEYLLKTGSDTQKKIDDLKRPEVFTVNGKTYIHVNGNLERVMPDKVFKPDLFRTFSLSGLVDFIRHDVDGIFKDESNKYMVRVTNPTLVEVLSPIAGDWKERVTVAQCEAPVPNIRFGCYMNADEFQIMLQTCFMDTPNRDTVLKVVGSVKKEQSMQTADDGVSQKITVNAGVATAAEVTFKNPVPLTPYRTFTEVKQPESPFVLRFDENGRAALFTGDPCAWKLESVENIKYYLMDELDGYNVVVIA